MGAGRDLPETKAAKLPDKGLNVADFKLDLNFVRSRHAVSIGDLFLGSARR
jgi:hypothetical protein